MSSPGHEDHHAGYESSIALHCLRRGWRRRRLGDELFLFDEQTEYLARVDDLAARRLAQAGTASTLREALAAAVDGTGADGGEVGPKPPTRAEDVVALRLLGVRMNVRRLHRRCGDEIRSYFSASAAELETASPAVVV